MRKIKEKEREEKVGGLRGELRVLKRGGCDVKVGRVPRERKGSGGMGERILVRILPLGHERKQAKTTFRAFSYSARFSRYYSKVHFQNMEPNADSLDLAFSKTPNRIRIRNQTQP